MHAQGFEVTSKPMPSGLQSMDRQAIKRTETTVCSLGCLFVQ